MCWEGRVKDKRIATRNITVYKVLERYGRTKNKSYRSPFKFYPYKMGYCYGMEYDLEVRKYINYACIDQGFHCYSPNAYALFNKAYKTVSIHNTRHSDCPVYHYLSNNQPGYRTVIVKCTIPKGSIYYINDRGEVVTDRLRLDYELGVPTNTSPLRLRELYKNNLFE